MQLFQVSTPDPKYPIPFYFIESTAPDNVDETSTEAEKKYETPIPGLRRIRDTQSDHDQVITSIAEHLLPEENKDPSESKASNLVVMVHGFNNPRDDALKTFVTAAKAILADKVGICKDPSKLVCIGYRWPSEKIGAPFWGSIPALPLLPFWLFWAGVIGLLYLLVLSPILGKTDRLPHADWSDAILAWLSFGLMVVTVVGIVLRSIVYFRDIYRATNYGVPDLVEVIRDIDRVVWERERTLKRDVTPRRIGLSFIGHSMGGLVVTNVIRILSDVFAASSQVRSFGGRRLVQGGGQSSTDERGGEAETAGPERISGDIGHVFSLMRLILVSPDIPAEALLGNRANFLKSSLRRFREAYLFSNEGDEVLRQISTLANYFSFPTKSNKYGYRLGNVELLSEDDGIIDEISSNDLPDRLRIGQNTIKGLHDKLVKAKNLPSKFPPAYLDESPAYAFSYFDCTDYIDHSDDFGDKTRRYPLLSSAQRRKKYLIRDGKLFWFEHLGLLARYLAGQKNCIYRYINVHGGYFEGQSVRLLIYRLACLGFDGAVAAYGGIQQLYQMCLDCQIKVRLSDRLALPTPVMSTMILETIDELREKINQQNKEIARPT